MKTWNSIINLARLTTFLTIAASITMVNASAPTGIKADASKGEIIYNQGLQDKAVPACISCHGAAGNSAGGANPRLAGQHAAYTIKQLHHFKTPERNNAIMTAYAKQLTDQDMADIGAYLEKQTPKIGKTKSTDAADLGQKIYRAGVAGTKVPACASCHGPSGSGMPAQFPRVGGQSSEYSYKQLMDFKTGNRKTNTSMHEIASRLTDKEMKAVSDYMSALTSSHVSIDKK